MNAHDAICKAAHDALCKVRTPHASHAWSSPVPFFDYVADEIEAAVSAAGYSITLTDDGVALPVRRDGEGPLAAAPSSPHPCDHEPLVGLYDDTRTLTIQGSINHEVMIKLGDEEAFFTWADSFLATAQCAAYEAGEGATPATNHRPTCGTTYGESCDGYCPTPAIDRRQIIRTLYDQGAYCGSCDYESHDWAVFDWTDCADCKRVLGKYADAVLALIEGAQ